MTEGVKIAFERRVISVAVVRLLPTRALPPGLHETAKYRRIAASVSEVGLIEPLSVARQKDGAYLLLDGHVQLDALRAQGAVEAACIIANDDKSFTYNKRVNRLAPIQEHHMIARALERGVSEDETRTGARCGRESYSAAAFASGRHQSGCCGTAQGQAGRPQRLPKAP